VAPGETKKIVVKMNTHAWTSDLLKEIKVETNDPNMSLLTLTMKAHVFEALKVSPRALNFGLMQPNQTLTKDITVENNGKKPIKITRIFAASEPQSGFTVTPDEPFTLKPGESRKLTVKMSAGTTTGFQDNTLTLETDIPYLPQKKIYTHVEVRDKINQVK
jgi:hypothetical protein